MTQTQQTKTINFIQVNLNKAEVAHVHLLQNLDKLDTFLAFVQEPFRRKRILAKLPRGNTTVPGPQVPAPRAALYASDNLGLQELQGLCTPDCACALITLNGRKILVASLYFDGTLPIRQAFLEKLFQYADRKDLPMILACDSNSHSTLFGPDQNRRGD